MKTQTMKEKRINAYTRLKERLLQIGMSQSCISDTEKICGKNEKVLLADCIRWRRIYGFGIGASHNG